MAKGRNDAPALCLGGELDWDIGFSRSGADFPVIGRETTTAGTKPSTAGMFIAGLGPVAQVLCQRLASANAVATDQPLLGADRLGLTVWPGGVSMRQLRCRFVAGAYRAFIDGLSALPGRARAAYPSRIGRRRPKA
jgi:hypothetical protein